MDEDTQKLVQYIRSTFGIEPLETEIEELLILSHAILNKSTLEFSPRYPQVSGWWWVRESQMDQVVHVAQQEVKGQLRLCAKLDNRWRDVRHMTWVEWAGPIPLPTKQKP